VPAATNCVLATISPGVNEVSFTDVCTGQNCSPNPGDPIPALEIVKYSLVSQQTAEGRQTYQTYRADLLSTEAALGPMVASVKSLDPSRFQVIGRGTLSFPPTPAYGQITSNNTFTILADPDVPLDFSQLIWTFESARSVTRRRGR
jgi:hypothetical protein